MSALKGFDRIALVLAAIAIVPGAYIGYLWDQDWRRFESPAYKLWKDEKEAIIEDRNEARPRIRMENQERERKRKKDRVEKARNKVIEVREVLRVARLEREALEAIDAKALETIEVYENAQVELRKAKKEYEWSKKSLRGEFDGFYLGSYGNPIKDELNRTLPIPTEPEYWKYPPVLVSALVGIFVFGSMSFLVVLFGVRWSVRGTYRFGLWIAKGFNDKKTSHNYWQEVLNNKNKMLIALPSKMVERLGKKSIKEKFGNCYKSKGKYYVAVNRNNHKNMLGERWKKSIKEVGRDKRWQALIKKSNYEKGKVAEYLEEQSGSVPPGECATESAKD